MRHRLLAFRLAILVVLPLSVSLTCSAQALKSSATLGFSVQVGGAPVVQPSVQLLSASSTGEMRLLIPRSLLSRDTGQVLARIYTDSKIKVLDVSTNVGELLSTPASTHQSQVELQLPATPSDTSVLEIEILRL